MMKNPKIFSFSFINYKSKILVFLSLIVTIMGSIYQVVGQNLILNSSAELDPLTNHWTQVSGPWTKRCENPEAYDGSCYFFAGVQSAVAEIYQDVDVSGNSTDIDNGVANYLFSTRLRSYNQDHPDAAQVILEFRDSGGTGLSDFDTGETFEKTGWKQYMDTLLAPIGTRTIRCRLLSTRYSGNDSDGFMDHLYLSNNSVLPDEYTVFPNILKSLMKPLNGSKYHQIRVVRFSISIAILIQHIGKLISKVFSQIITIRVI